MPVYFINIINNEQIKVYDDMCIKNAIPQIVDDKKYYHVMPYDYVVALRIMKYEFDKGMNNQLIDTMSFIKDISSYTLDPSIHFRDLYLNTIIQNKPFRYEYIQLVHENILVAKYLLYTKKSYHISHHFSALIINPRCCDNNEDYIDLLIYLGFTKDGLDFRYVLGSNVYLIYKDMRDIHSYIDNLGHKFDIYTGSVYAETFVNRIAHIIYYNTLSTQNRLFSTIFNREILYYRGRGMYVLFDSVQMDIPSALRLCLLHKISF
jgi:hypothetical protein